MKYVKVIVVPALLVLCISAFVLQPVSGDANVIRTITDLEMEEVLGGSSGGSGGYTYWSDMGCTPYTCWTAFTVCTGPGKCEYCTSGASGYACSPWASYENGCKLVGPYTSCGWRYVDGECESYDGGITYICEDVEPSYRSCLACPGTNTNPSCGVATSCEDDK